jgi:hypothetical protein
LAGILVTAGILYTGGILIRFAISYFGLEQVTGFIDDTRHQPKGATPRDQDIELIAQQRAASAMGLDVLSDSLPKVSSLDIYPGCPRCYEARGRVPQEKQGVWGSVDWQVILQVDKDNGVRAVRVAIGSKNLFDDLPPSSP